jgi:hypothetical protein
MRILSGSMTRLVLLLIAAGMLLQTSGSFVNPYKDDKQPAVKSDVQYIKCQVCKLIVKHARSFVKNARLERGLKRVHMQLWCPTGGWQLTPSVCPTVRGERHHRPP